VEIDGRTQTFEVNSDIGQRAVLRELLDQGVTEATVTYTSLLEPGTRTGTVQISPDMLDVWTKRIAPFGLDVQAHLKKIVIRERNPLKAMMVGIRKTYYFIEQVYVMMERMLVSRTVSVDQVSGPVGIFKMGGDFANLGMVY